MMFLSLNNSSHHAIIDDEDFERLSKFTWTINSFQTVINRWYQIKERNRWHSEAVSLASEVMCKPRVMHDHINRNPFDNRKENIRECTVSQNSINKPKQLGFTSKFKGVSWDKDSKKWFSKVQCKRKQYALGRFITEIEAASAYSKKAIELYKNFAILNLDPDGNVL